MLPFQFLHCDDAFFKALELARMLNTPVVASVVDPLILKAVKLSMRFQHYVRTEDLYRKDGKEVFSGYPTNGRSLRIWPLECRKCKNIFRLADYCSRVSLLLEDVSCDWQSCDVCQQELWTSATAAFYSTFVKNPQTTMVHAWQSILDGRISSEALLMAEAVSLEALGEIVVGEGGVVPLDLSQVWLDMSQVILTTICQSPLLKFESQRHPLNWGDSIFTKTHRGPQ